MRRKGPMKHKTRRLEMSRIDFQIEVRNSKFRPRSSAIYAPVAPWSIEGIKIGAIIDGNSSSCFKWRPGIAID